MQRNYRYGLMIVSTQHSQSCSSIESGSWSQHDLHCHCALQGVRGLDGKNAAGLPSILVHCSTLRQLSNLVCTIDTHISQHTPSFSPTGCGSWSQHDLHCRCALRGMRGLDGKAAARLQRTAACSSGNRTLSNSRQGLCTCISVSRPNFSVRIERSAEKPTSKVH